MNVRQLIYKFRAPNAFGLQDLADRSLLCRHFGDFNDPFEFWSTILSGVPDQHRDQTRFVEAVRTWGFADLSIADDPPEMHQEYFESLMDSEPRFAQMRDRARITCFASESSNLLMWSHYADGMRGFCVGLDPNILCEADPESYLAPVGYETAPPVVDSFVYAVAKDQYEYHMLCVEEHDRGAGGSISAADRPEFMKAAREARAQLTGIWHSVFVTKPACWSYEKEQRLIVWAPEAGNEPKRIVFQPDAVREVVIGERIPPAYRHELLSVVRKVYGEVRVRIAHRARGSYEVVFSESPE